MTIEPVGPRILAATPPAESRRDSGLILPDHYDRVKIAIVMKCGEDLHLAGVEIEPGDVIYYVEGYEEKLRDLLIIEAQHIIAIERN